MNREFAGVFHSETELLAKIHELHKNGIAEDNMYVVTKDKDDVSIVRGRTDAEIQDVDASWWDRFTAFLSDEHPARKALTEMDLTQDETDRYLAAVENGAFLLYVDKGDFWDASSHDKGDLTSAVTEKKDLGGYNVLESNEMLKREIHDDEWVADGDEIHHKY
ncbi:hypothetical protein DVB69_06195 [Sporosarcina sp. BI001-red]|uniref:general stress protein n=1 Tax=Sporosarcina sp. BI001-red TaxID=2282866 RepID=UPI000E25D45A|nr:general stress protein [Sporosarcina sp. BI001-red]REB08715.1 hypothetical protein DVB69_06195 [Sporosarcina sp. BI001-red]